MSVAILASLVFAMTFSGTMGALFFKKASSTLDFSNPLRILCNLYLYAGGCCYLLGAVLNILLLRHMEYSLLYPMTSLTYIWTMFISAIFLKEKINQYKILALCFIITGIILISL